MKVLILSVCTGHGHNQVAASIMNRLNEEENITCTIVDILNYVSPILGKSISEGYLIATKYIPTYYGSFYRKAEKMTSDTNSSLSSIVDLLLSKKLSQLFQKQEADIIICTHVFAARLLSHFPTQLANIPKVGIITDYTLHPFWEKTDLDFYITPSDNVVDEAIKKGISKEKLLAFGMPVHEKFLKIQDKISARYELGLLDKNTILVMGGSMGFGYIDEEIQKLDKIDIDFQIICICGTNTEMKEKIESLHTNKKVYCYGFVNNVEVFMDAADCIITKPGGITVSECLVKGLPMLLTNPIPGQEDRNAQFLDSTGAALIINEELSLERAIGMFFQESSLKFSLEENIKRIAKPRALEDICKLINRESCITTL